MTGNYLTLLEESLRRKLQVLDEIQAYNLRQQEVFEADQADIDKFDEYVAEKGALIDKLTSLDNGFGRLYTKVSEELKDNQVQYADQIKVLQELITQVTDAGVTIQAQEARNKKLVEAYFHKERENIGKGRRTSKAAMNYYKSMSRSSIATPQYMDSKK